MKTTYTEKLVMQRAWALARRGQTIFGGPIRSYIREALRESWAAVKADPVVKVADQMISEIRARKGQTAGMVPYSIRSRGHRAVARFYASHGARS